MKQTRRDFIKTSSLAAAALGTGGTVITDWYMPAGAFYPDEDPALLKQLAGTALQAAKDGGATYADVRFTRTRRVVVRMGSEDVEPPMNFNRVHVGVRVLLDGVWGFAAMATRSNDEVAKVARTAIRQAKSSAWANHPKVELAETPKVENGSWVMPVEIDPLSVPIGQILADIEAGHNVAQKAKNLANVMTRWDFVRQDIVFASSEGSYITQRTYNSLPSPPGYAILALKNSDGSESKELNAPFMWAHGAGYEVAKNANYPAVMEKMVVDCDKLLKAPPVDVGMFDVVLSGDALGAVVGCTLGDHTQIDRALGFEANASGTSFVAPPEDVLGKMKLGNEQVTVKINHMHDMSPANAKWDLEGVPTEEFTVIEKGLLVDYQTTREQVAWMKDYYRASNRPMKSHGCAWAVDANNIQLQTRPNVILEPSTKETKIDELCSGIDRGVYFEGGIAWTDHQGVTGQHGLLGLAYEIRKGKVGQMVKDAALIFQTSDMFKKLTTLGGRSTYEFRGGGTYKGEPWQLGLPTGIGAPAARFKDGRVSNIGRKPV
jgi:TldD protein